MAKSSVICEKCGEEIHFNKNYQCALGEHLVKKHPKDSMVYFTFPNEFSEYETKSGSSRSSKRPIKSCLSSSNRSSDKHVEVKDDGIYRASVESWAAGPVSVTCSACGYYGSPCIRKQRNKVAYTSLGALFLMGCWPICFMPLLTSSSRIQLFCKKCSHYLGEYNRKTGKFMSSGKSSNRCCSCCKCKTKK